MSILENNVLNQIAFVVQNIETASSSFAELLGVPKQQPFLTGPPKASQVVLRGQPSNARNKLIFIDTPSVQIELIEPDCNQSILREYLDQHGEGIHHVAFDVERIPRYKTALRTEGYEILQTGEFTSSKGRYAYVDTQGTCKTLVELLERDEPRLVSQLNLEEAARQSLLGTNTVTQIGFVVRDLLATAAAYCTLLGIERPDVVQSGPAETTRIQYRGKPTEAAAQFLFIKTPQIEIELIQPAAESSSTWADSLRDEGEGVHHIAFEVVGVQKQIETLESRGWHVVQRGHFYNGRGEYAYIDTRSDLKVMIELLEKYT